MAQNNLLKEYADKERLLKQLKQQLDALENDPRLKSELEFKDRLENLMNEYDKKARDVIDLLAPEHSSNVSSKESNGGQRRKRKLKIYKHPKTGEVLETRGGNQKTLKAWKEEHGDEVVEGWLIRVEE